MDTGKLSNEDKKKIEIYEYAMEDMSQGMENIVSHFGGSLSQTMKRETLEKAFMDLLHHMKKCKNNMISSMSEDE